jgi:hypothetical protein
VALEQAIREMAVMRVLERERERERERETLCVRERGRESRYAGLLC